MAYNNLPQDNSARYQDFPPPSPNASAPPLPSGLQFPPPPKMEYPPHPFPTPPSPLLYASSPVHVYTPPLVYHAQLHQVDGYPQPQGPFVVPPPAVAYPERNGPKAHRQQLSHQKTKGGCCCGFWRGCCAALCCCCLIDLCCCPLSCCF